MRWVIGTITSSAVFSCHFINSGFIHHITPTPWIVRICSAHEQTVIVLFGQHTNVVVAIIFRFSFDETKLRVAISRVPFNSLVQIFRQVVKTYVIYDISSPDQKRVSILIQQFEMVCVSLISKESLNISYNNYGLDTELSSFAY